MKTEANNEVMPVPTTEEGWAVGPATRPDWVAGEPDDTEQAVRIHIRFYAASLVDVPVRQIENLPPPNENREPGWFPAAERQGNITCEHQ